MQAEEWAALNERLRDMVDGLEAIRINTISDGKELVRLRASMEALASDVDELKKVLVLGNGQPALTSRVAVLEARDRRSKKMQGATAGAAAAPGAIALVMNLLQHFMK